MSLESTNHIIQAYGYWILIPLALLEGPIVAFAAGMLASLGYFNIYALALLFFVRDMVMDALYYGLGYFGSQNKSAQRCMLWLGVRDSHLDKIRTLWNKHAGKTMFFGKLSYGIASSFIILAGVVKMPWKKFFAYGALVSVLQFWTLLALGYFFGSSLGGRAAHILEVIQYIFAGIMIFGSLYYIVSLSMRNSLLKNDRP